jgi:exopolysaccharide biosynthesis polyprenyl glycosylphosphotransferase
MPGAVPGANEPSGLSEAQVPSLAIGADGWRAPSGLPRGLWARLFDEPLFTRATASLDVVLASVAVLIALQVQPDARAAASIAALVSFPLLVAVLFWRKGLYRWRLRAVFSKEVGRVAAAASLAAMALTCLLVPIDPRAAGPLAVAVWIVAMPLLALGRLARALLQRRLRRRRDGGEPALVVGAGTVGALVARRLHERSEFGLRAVGFLDWHPGPAVTSGKPAPVLGTPDDVERIAAETGAEHVIIAFSSESDRDLLSVARRCQSQGLRVSVVPRLFDATNQRLELEHLGGLPMFSLHDVSPHGWQFSLKYAMDRLGALLAIVCLSAVLLGLAVAIRLSSPGPVLYRQRRVGRDGKPFDLLKFRSMTTVVAGEETEFTPLTGVAPGGVEGIDRRTPIGRWLRRTSLDELPQLFNVLRGDMSLIGPRPERPEFASRFQREIDRYGERQRVKAGMTGWAQVHGLRGQTSIADRSEWDNYYIANWSLLMDLEILVLTVGAMLRRNEDT